MWGLIREFRFRIFKVWAQDRALSFFLGSSKDFLRAQLGYMVTRVYGRYMRISG